MSTNGKNTGTILEIKGVVLDVRFTDDLPGIYNALEITRPDGTTLVAEVQQLLGDDKVRAVALDTTDGLSRGTDVIDTGAPISVPVGEPTLGRIFNVLGEAIDEGGPVNATEKWPIHRDPPAFDALSPTSEIFETGIKVIDLICPVHQGRQERPVRRRRRRQDRRHHGVDQQHRQRPRRLLRVRRGG